MVYPRTGDDPRVCPASVTGKPTELLSSKLRKLVLIWLTALSDHEIPLSTERPNIILHEGCKNLTQKPLVYGLAILFKSRLGLDIRVVLNGPNFIMLHKKEKLFCRLRLCTAQFFELGLLHTGGAQAKLYQILKILISILCDSANLLSS